MQEVGQQNYAMGNLYALECMINDTPDLPPSLMLMIGIYMIYHFQ